MFATTTTEAETNREYLASRLRGEGKLVSVCDDCYVEVMAQARAKGLL